MSSVAQSVVWVVSNEALRGQAFTAVSFGTSQTVEFDLHNELHQGRSAKRLPARIFLVNSIWQTRRSRVCSCY